MAKRVKSRAMKTQGWFGSRVLLIGVALAGLSACGGGSSSPASGYGDAYDPRNQLPMDNLTESQRNALRTSVSCADGNCNPAVAMLIATTDGGLGACTASLVGPDLMVTNAHCIPDDLRNRDRADASGRIYLFFPSTNGYGEERAEAATVVKSEHWEARTATPDYAYVRLKAASRRPVLPMSGDGFVSGTRYALEKVDPFPQGDHFSGLLRKTTCTAIGPTLYTPADDRPMTANSAFHDCDIEHGNSGSPILDDAGRIHGVIQSMYSPSLLGALLGSSKFLDGMPRSLGFGTNLGCVYFPEVLPGHFYPGSCEADTSSVVSTESAQKNSAAVAARLEQQVLERVKGTLPPPLEDVFEWKVMTRETGHLLTKQTRALVAPKCFREEALWTKHYKGLFGPKSSVTVELLIPNFGLKFGINAYLQVDGRIDSNGEGFYLTKLRFSPKDLVNKGGSLVTLTDTSTGIFGTAEYFNSVVLPCSNTTGVIDPPRR